MGPCDTRCRSKSQFEEVRPTLTDKEVGAAGAQTGAPLACLNIRPISTWSWLVGDHRVWHLRHPELRVDFSCWKHQRVKQRSHVWLSHTESKCENKPSLVWLTHTLSENFTHAVRRGVRPSPPDTHMHMHACKELCLHSKVQNDHTAKCFNTELNFITHYYIQDNCWAAWTELNLQKNTPKLPPPKKNKHLHAGYPINNKQISNNVPISIILKNIKCWRFFLKFLKVKSSKVELQKRKSNRNEPTFTRITV